MLLPDFVQGNSPAEEKYFVEQHLAECPLCVDEVARMNTLMTSLKQISRPAPSQAYWGTILPRIHLGIQRKPFASYPQWVVRYLAPAAAFVLLVVVLSSNVPHERFHDADLTAVVGDLSEDELLQIADQTALNNDVASVSPPEVSFASAEDIDVLKQLLVSEDHAALYAEVVADESGEILSDQEEAQLVASLQQQPVINR